MPYRPLRPCFSPGCPNLCAHGNSYCKEHLRLRARNRDRGRLSSKERGYDSAWRKNRLDYLRAYPICVVCGQLATDVDHIVPLAKGGSNEWTNLQAMCHSCHAKKTVSQDGGYGR